jgi:hypothetical protein
MDPFLWLKYSVTGKGIDGGVLPQTAWNLLPSVQPGGVGGSLPGWPNQPALMMDKQYLSVIEISCECY